VNRRAVLVIAEGRSGSTTFGGLAFRARPDFAYFFEPCRQRAQPTLPGRLSGEACARHAINLLSCRIGVRDFEELWIDRIAISASSEWLIHVREAANGSLAAAYHAMMHRCWTSHRAVKVIRSVLGVASALPVRSSPSWLQRPRSTPRAQNVPPLPALAVVHLLRSPAKVVASRLSLPAFSDVGEFNQPGGVSGVIASVCLGMRLRDAPRDADGEPIKYARHWFEDYLDHPRATLATLFEWLGLPRHLPEPILAILRRCEQTNGSTAGWGRRRFGVRACGGTAASSLTLDPANLSHTPPELWRPCAEVLRAAPDRVTRSLGWLKAIG